MEKFIENLIEKWPKAIPEDRLCISEEDRVDRAEGIMELMAPSGVQDLKVLDFGCGDGHFTKLAAEKGAAVSVGYDIVMSETSALPYEQDDSVEGLLTTNQTKVEDHAPYDLIIMYDVLDHAERPIETLRNVGKLLTDDGELHIRFHPFCGRHGGHQYKEANKAFLHLILDDNELTQMGVTPVPERNRVYHPLNTYRNWIKKAKLKVKKEHVTKEKVEPFFHKPKIAKRILSKFKTDEFPEFQMKQSFIDYILRKA